MTNEQMEFFKKRRFRGSTPEERFWKRVDKKHGHGPNGDCWIWLASCNKNGYGQVQFSDLSTSTHRVSYELVHGPIGNNYVDCVLHSCDNPPCVNPDHLFMGGRKDNVADMVSKGRMAGAKGEKNCKDVLTEAQVMEIFKSDASNVDLGEEYGVAPTTISAIRTQRNWKYLTGHLPTPKRRRVSR